jgi:hypothetical protein
MAGCLRNGAKRGFATTAQEKEYRRSTGNRCERDYDHDVVHEVRNHSRFSYRDRESRYMLLRAAHGDQTDEFTGLLEAIFETDEAVRVYLGR